MGITANNNVNFFTLIILKEKKKDKGKKKKELNRSKDKTLEQVVLSDDENGLEEFLTGTEESGEYSTDTSMVSPEFQVIYH